MNPLAIELNDIIKIENNSIMELLSDFGKRLFFPKGILVQTAEAGEKAYKYNATAGIATSKGKPIYLNEFHKHFNDLEPEEIYTYAKSQGNPKLRELWLNRIINDNPNLNKSNISSPLVCNALTHGISIVADMFADKDDVLVLPHIYWGNYNLIFQTKKEVNIEKYNMFKNDKFDTESFSTTMNSVASNNDKILLMLNFPHNPTGYTIFPDEMQKIKDIIMSLANKGKKIIVICDDAYYGLFYENSIKSSPINYLADMHENVLTIKIDGITKELFAWGFRIGFITYNTKAKGNQKDLYTALEKKTAGAIRASISNASNLAQRLVVKLLEENNYHNELEKFKKEIETRSNLTAKIAHNDEYKDLWHPYPFNSGYFMCIKLLNNLDSEKVRQHLLNNHGVGLISTPPDVLRVAFSCVDVENLEDIFAVIAKGCREMIK